MSTKLDGCDLLFKVIDPNLKRMLDLSILQQWLYTDAADTTALSDV